MRASWSILGLALCLAAGSLGAEEPEAGAPPIVLPTVSISESNESLLPVDSKSQVPSQDRGLTGLTAGRRQIVEDGIPGDKLDPDKARERMDPSALARPAGGYQTAEWIIHLGAPGEIGMRLAQAREWRRTSLEFSLDAGQIQERWARTPPRTRWSDLSRAGGSLSWGWRPLDAWDFRVSAAFSGLGCGLPGPDLTPAEATAFAAWTPDRRQVLRGLGRFEASQQAGDTLLWSAALQETHLAWREGAVPAGQNLNHLAGSGSLEWDLAPGPLGISLDLAHDAGLGRQDVLGQARVGLAGLSLPAAWAEPLRLDAGVLGLAAWRGSRGASGWLNPAVLPDLGLTARLGRAWNFYVLWQGQAGEGGDLTSLTQSPADAAWFALDAAVERGHSLTLETGVYGRSGPAEMRLSAARRADVQRPFWSDADQDGRWTLVNADRLFGGTRLTGLTTVAGSARLTLPRWPLTASLDGRWRHGGVAAGGVQYQMFFPETAGLRLPDLADWSGEFALDWAPRRDLSVTVRLAGQSARPTGYTAAGLETVPGSWSLWGRAAWNPASIWQVAAEAGWHPGKAPEIRKGYREWPWQARVSAGVRF